MSDQPTPRPDDTAPVDQANDRLGGLDPELARIVRHDIKTPLQAASLNLELLAMEQHANRDVTDAIQVIQRSLDSAIDMLKRLEDD